MNKLLEVSLKQLTLLKVAFVLFVASISTLILNWYIVAIALIIIALGITAYVGYPVYKIYKQIKTTLDEMEDISKEMNKTANVYDKQAFNMNQTRNRKDVTESANKD